MRKCSAGTLYVAASLLLQCSNAALSCFLVFFNSGKEKHLLERKKLYLTEKAP